jgi:hypothetical protein
LGFQNQENSDSMVSLLRGAASMEAAVSITRLDLTASELRKAASGEKEGAA